MWYNVTYILIEWRLFIMKKNQFANLVEECEKSLNYVNFDGIRYYISSQAFVDTDEWGDTIYKAYAYNGELEDSAEEELQCYLVTWNLTEEYKEYTRLHDEYVESHDGDTNSEWIGYLEDESNDCDWDDPISVEKYM